MWRVRLLNEFNSYTKEQRSNSYFVTLTINNSNIKIPPNVLIRRFLERIRKKVGHSVRHWFTTEFGKSTQRLHFHGILFDLPFDRRELFSYWKYGFVDIRPLTHQRISYITKYITKSADDWVVAPKYKQLVFTSPGLGKAYTEDPTNIRYHHQQDSLLPLMSHGGHTLALPRYYRQKVFTAQELERLKTAYFANLSPDVIPDPPYRLGRMVYDDWTIYQIEIAKIRKLHKRLYPRYYHKDNTLVELSQKLNFDGNKPDHEPTQF